MRIDRCIHVGLPNLIYAKCMNVHVRALTSYTFIYTYECIYVGILHRKGKCVLFKISKLYEKTTLTANGVFGEIKF